jgi:AraC family transcriptional activator of mtrCDE
VVLNACRIVRWGATIETSELELLDRVLENLRVNVDPFAVCEVSADWRLRLTGTPWVTIHYIVSGEGTLHLPGRDPAPLTPCTLVVMPSELLHIVEAVGGSHHEERHDRGPRPDGLLQFVAGVEGDRELQVACGRLSAVYGGNVDVFGRLREPVVLCFDADPSMARIFDRLLDEQRHPTAGSAAMCAVLMNECIVHVLRAMAQQHNGGLAWLAAIADPHLAPVLEEMLEHPDAPHTVETLAARASMSRSTFHDHFTAAFGESPISYLREVRLRKAADLLRSSQRSIPDIASRVGFASRSQFSRAFRDMFGQSPTAFRTPNG